MNKFVLDSCALLAFLQCEKGWKRIKELFDDVSKGNAELYMSRINLAEVEYLLLRRSQNIDQILAAIQTLPIIFTSVDEYIPQMVKIKAKYPMSIADCFAAVLAQDMNCTIITIDPEFKSVESFIQIEWL